MTEYENMSAGLKSHDQTYLVTCVERRYRTHKILISMTNKISMINIKTLLEWKWDNESYVQQYNQKVDLNLAWESFKFAVDPGLSTQNSQRKWIREFPIHDRFSLR
eukprot:GHVP01000174.1.p1 GENE.GHVP01000174.1~~GHVP01000174.1.p1  ORF type:complete len:106 (-),score=14.12 GHVP01000174.1:13-330(-)